MQWFKKEDKYTCHNTLVSISISFLLFLSLYQSVYLSTYLAIYLATYLSMYLPIYLSIHRSIHPSMCIQRTRSWPQSLRSRHPIHGTWTTGRPGQWMRQVVRIGTNGWSQRWISSHFFALQRSFPSSLVGIYWNLEWWLFDAGNDSATLGHIPNRSK